MNTDVSVSDGAMPSTMRWPGPLIPLRPGAVPADRDGPWSFPAGPTGLVQFEPVADGLEIGEGSLLGKFESLPCSLNRLSELPQLCVR